MLKTLWFNVGLFAAFFMFSASIPSYKVVTCQPKVSVKVFLIDSVVVKQPKISTLCI